MVRTIAIAVLAGSLSFASAAEQLFNGKDLSGWKMVGPGRFVVEDGMLKTEGGMGLLYYTGKKFGDTTLRVVFKTNGQRDNSGVFIRLNSLRIRGMAFTTATRCRSIPAAMSGIARARSIR
jgi:hypothetical protein